MSNDYILCIQMPMQPQTLLAYPDEMSAVQAVNDGIKNGLIQNKAEAGIIFVHTVPGTVYIILTKKAFERQQMQQQLLSRQHGG